MTKRIALFALSATVAMGMALAAAEAKEFRYSTGQDIQGLDPATNNHGGTNAMKSNVYEALVYRTVPGGLQPGLATDWQQLSPTSWRFNLRKGVKFHGGEDFDADDVIFTYARLKQAEAQMQYTVLSVKEVRKVDSHTIDIETNGPDPTLLSNLSYAFIMDEGWTKANGGERVVAGAQASTFVNLNANGTGPFKVIERVPDTRTVLEPNANWWGKHEHGITKATFQPIANPATRVAALLSGELDLMYHVPLQDMDRVAQAPGIRVMPGGTARVIFLGFDHRRDELLDMPGSGKNPLKDIRVRQALSHAINIEAIRRTTMRNASTPNALIVAPSLPGFPADINVRPAFDQTAARRLLAEAGYPNGFPLTLNCPNNRYVNDEAICQNVITMFTQVGIQARLNAQPMAQHVNTSGPPNYSSSMYLLGWTPGNLDVSNPLIELLTFNEQARLGLANNWGRYNNPKLNEITQRILVETDVAKRNAMVKEALQIVRDDVAYIPLHLEPQVFGVRETVAEYTLRALEDVDLRGVKMR